MTLASPPAGASAVYLLPRLGGPVLPLLQDGPRSDENPHVRAEFTQRRGESDRERPRSWTRRAARSCRARPLGGYPLRARESGTGQRGAHYGGVRGVDDIMTKHSSRPMLLLRSLNRAKYVLHMPQPFLLYPTTRFASVCALNGSVSGRGRMEVFIFLFWNTRSHVSTKL